MAKAHRWAEVIKAWAEGADIEVRSRNNINDSWDEAKWQYATPNPTWENNGFFQYRVKPTPSAPTYAFAYQGDNGAIYFTTNAKAPVDSNWRLVGRVKIDPLLPITGTLS